jgi:hypothetical protein
MDTKSRQVRKVRKVVSGLIGLSESGIYIRYTGLDWGVRKGTSPPPSGMRKPRSTLLNVASLIGCSSSQTPPEAAPHNRGSELAIAT